MGAHIPAGHKTDPGPSPHTGDQRAEKKLGDPSLWILRDPVPRVILYVRYGALVQLQGERALNGDRFLATDFRPAKGKSR